MSLQTIDYRTAILTVLLEVRYTRSRLRAHPQGAPFVAAFDALRDECLAAIQEDLQLQEARTDAQATVDAVNDGLNALCNRFSKAILTITGESRKHGLYRHFFKGKDLKKFKRRKLGQKRDDMGDWVGPSRSGEHPALLAMAEELVAALAAADLAAAAKKEALRRRGEFRDVGSRRKLVDHVNAVRKSTHGALASLAHERADLPLNFAGLFFRKESKPRGDAPVTIEGATARVEELRDALAEAEAQAADIEAEAQAAARAMQARAAKEAERARLGGEIAALEARLAALEAEGEALRPDAPRGRGRAGS